MKDYKIVYDGCMISFSGKMVNLYDPKPEDIHIEDIAHGLAMTCRWNGATKTFYSVAEHCCMMYDSIEQEHKKTALFHDAEEAYWGDIIKPVKNLLPSEMREKMRFMRSLIFEKFEVDPIGERVEEEDARLLKWDYEHLILTNNHAGWSPKEAKVQWLMRYQELTEPNLFESAPPSIQDKYALGG